MRVAAIGFFPEAASLSEAGSAPIRALEGRTPTAKGLRETHVSGYGRYEGYPSRYPIGR